MEQASEQLCSRTQRAVIITLGPRGALLKEPGIPPRLIPTKPVPMVDSTGAGDNHAGAVLAGLGQGMNYPQAVQRANIVSGYAVQQKGTVLRQKNFSRAIADWNAECQG